MTPEFEQALMEQRKIINEFSKTIIYQQNLIKNFKEANKKYERYARSINDEGS